MDNVQLRREALDLEGRILARMFACNDDAQWKRLRHAQRRAERRYWRRYERAFPSGNQTPPWFYRDAKPGY